MVLAGAVLALLTGLGHLVVSLGDLAATADYCATAALKAALALMIVGALLSLSGVLLAGAGWIRGWWDRGTGLRLTGGGPRGRARGRPAAVLEPAGL